MSVRRLMTLGVLVLTALLLQVSVLPRLAGGAFVPDLMLVLVVVLALEHGPRMGMRVAAAGGLLGDLGNATVPLGTSMLVLVTVAYLIGLLRPYVAERADLTTAVLAGVAGVMALLCHAALAALLSAQVVPVASVVVWSATVVGAFAVLMTPPVLAVVRRVLPRPDEVDAGLAR